jgi:flagellar hook-length control protein FliK
VISSQSFSTDLAALLQRPPESGLSGSGTGAFGRREGDAEPAPDKGFALLMALPAATTGPAPTLAGDAVQSNLATLAATPATATAAATGQDMQLPADGTGMPAGGTRMPAGGKLVPLSLPAARSGALLFSTRSDPDLTAREAADAPAELLTTAGITGAGGQAPAFSSKVDPALTGSAAAAHRDLRGLPLPFQIMHGQSHRHVALAAMTAQAGLSPSPAESSSLNAEFDGSPAATARFATDPAAVATPAIGGFRLEHWFAGKAAMDKRSTADLDDPASAAQTQLHRSSVTSRDTPAVLSPPLPATAAQQPDFDRAVGERLLWMIQSGRQDARLKVSPADLGSIDIQLKLDGDEARLTLSSPHAAVRDALEVSVPRLRELLTNSGVDLTQVDVGQGDAHTAGQPGDETAAHAPRAAFAQSVAEDTLPVGRVSGAAPLGLVDTYA